MMECEKCGSNTPMLRKYAHCLYCGNRLVTNQYDKLTEEGNG